MGGRFFVDTVNITVVLVLQKSHFVDENLYKTVTFPSS